MGRPLTTESISRFEGADDPAGQGLIQAERIADGVAELADLQVVRGADDDGTQLVLGGVDLQHGDVFFGHAADEPGLVGGLVGERHLGGVGIADDVEVGDDVAVVVPDEPRAGALGHLAAC